MKYIITESRLNIIIDNYITNLIGDELVKHVHPSSMVGYVWWTDKYDNTVFESDETDDDLSLGVHEDIWYSIQSMFSLDTYDTDMSLMQWMKDKTGMDFPEGVYTFERG